MDNSDDLDARISAAIRAAGVPVQSTARALGIANASLHDRLSGRTMWRVRELPRVAAILGCRVRDLVDDEPDR